VDTPPIDAPAKKPRKVRTPKAEAQHQANMQRQRTRRSKKLVAEAATLGEVEKHCKGTSVLRGPDGQPILGPEGQIQRKPCGNRPIRGGTVCKYHGGNLPQVRAAAQRRLLAMVMPSLVRLNDLIHQDTHLATSLGAIRTVLERAGGEALGALKTKAEENTRPQIIIGIKVGGIANPHVEVGMRGALPAADDDGDYEEGELVEDGE
jgi:hypothetical protein